MPVDAASSRFSDLTVLAKYVGSFWTDRYEDSASVLNLLCGIATQQRQLEQLATQFERLHGRQSGPPTETWLKYPWSIVETDGQAETGLSVSYPAPAQLLEFTSVEILPRTVARCLTFGLDCEVAAGRLLFSRNPFETFVSQAETEVDGTRRLAIELINAEFDRANLQAIWKTTVGLDFPSTQEGQKFANSMMDALAGGPSWHTLVRALAVVADVPFSLSDEVVETIHEETDWTTIVTDRNVYRAAPAATILVNPGDRLSIDQPLTDAIKLFELTGGSPSAQITTLTVDAGKLWSGTSLGFQNSLQDIVVQTGVSGYTKISFPLVGDSGAIAAFFTELHTRGVAATKTLANYLDIRPLAAQVTQPTADNLPKKVNPLSLLCDYVLQGSSLVVQTDTNKFGARAIDGIDLSTLVTTLVSPHVNVFFS